CRVVRGRVAALVSRMKEMDARRRRNRIGLAAGAACLRIVRFDQREQRAPRHHLFHLGQEDLLAGPLALAHALGITERQLHRSSPSLRCAIVAQSGRVVQTFLKPTCVAEPATWQAYPATWLAERSAFGLNELLDVAPHGPQSTSSIRPNREFSL